MLIISDIRKGGLEYLATYHPIQSRVEIWIYRNWKFDCKSHFDMIQY